MTAQQLRAGTSPPARRGPGPTWPAPEVPGQWLSAFAPVPDPALGAEAASTAMRLRIWNPTPLTVRTDLTLPSGTKVLATRLDGTPEGHVDGGAPGEPAVDSRVADVGPTELRPVLWPWQVRTCTLAPAAAEGQGPRANR